MDNILSNSGSGIGSIQTMGIVNALKTGNVLLDMTIAMALPIAITFAINTAQKLHKSFFLRTWNRILHYFFPNKSATIHQRFIRHSTVTSSANRYSYYGSSGLGDDDTQNEILIKAIQLYVDAHGLLKVTNADLELRSFDSSNKKRNGYYSYYSDTKTNTVADTLSEYKVVKKPIAGNWFTVGNFDNHDEEVKDGHNAKACKVDMVILEDNKDSEEENKSSQKKETILQFRSEGKKSIDNFINKAYQWYLGELRKLEDDSRHMYELITKKEIQENENTPEKYKRYQLSDDKTFESLFFQQKDDVLKVVDHFTNKTGKYAIKGYPHKLGLLLHGPPGTGKTSLIKALAQHTGRSIVNIPLSRISTNAELASIFFDQKFNVEGERLPVQLGFKDIIFVMEDIDAVSKIVRRRDGKKTADVAYTEQIEMPITKSIWSMMIESTNSSCQELVELLIKKSDRLKEAAMDSSTLTASARRLTTVPGLSLVGEDIENETVGKAAMEALNSAKKLMGDYRTVGDFIGTHATTLKQIINTGAEITEEFEDELLGLAVNDSTGSDSFLSLKHPSLTTKMKTKQYGEEDDNIHVETSDSSSADCEEDAMMMMNVEANEGSGSSSSSKTGGKMGEASTSSWFKKKDELNLAGILNVLDGVVDTPGRMLVITTNHPEMLDPALIRPGRIDKKLFLGYISASDLVSMVEHYFQTSLNKDQVLRLETAIGSGTNESANKAALKLTPAQVEQMASEFENVEDMIEAVESKSLHVPKKSECKPRIVYGL